MTESEPSSPSHENAHIAFADKIRELLPGVEFEETAEMLEARTAVLEALTEHSKNAELLRAVWVEYAKVCEQIIDSTPADTDPQVRAKLQITALVHKALIFRETGDMQRYREELVDAEEYAFNRHFENIAEAIRVELDGLATLQ